MALPAIRQGRFRGRLENLARPQCVKKLAKLPTDRSERSFRIGFQALVPEGAGQLAGGLSQAAIPVGFRGRRKVGTVGLIDQLARRPDDDPAAGAAGCQRPANLPAGGLVRY